MNSEEVEGKEGGGGGDDLNLKRGMVFEKF